MFSVSGSLIELVAHTTKCSSNSCEKFGSKPLALPLSKIGISNGERTGAVNANGNGNASSNQNGCSNGSWNGSHWWPLSPRRGFSMLLFATTPILSHLCRPIRFVFLSFPGLVVIVAVVLPSSCEHLTIFAMALIGNGNFMRPQTGSLPHSGTPFHSFAFVQAFHSLYFAVFQPFYFFFLYF